MAGLISVFVGGWLLSALMLFIYVAFGIFPAPFANYLLPLTVIAFAAMLVESLPYKDVDNITMTLTAAIVGWLFFM